MILGYGLSYWAGLVVSGLTLGGVYALFSAGLTTVYGAARIMNFAQGEFMMVGGYLAWFCSHDFHLGFWPSLVAVGVVMALAGGLLSDGLFRRISRSPRALEVGIIATIGLSIVLQEGAQSLEGVTPRTPPGPFGSHVVDIGAVTIQDERFVALGLSLVVLGALALLFRRTRLGLAILAVPQNRELARTLGIPQALVSRTAIGLGAGLAGLAGVAIAPFYGVYPDMGEGFVFTGFAILFMGGMTNTAGMLAAAAAIGVVTSIMGGVVSATSASLAPLMVMAIVVLIRPQGLLSAQLRRA